MFLRLEHPSKLKAVPNHSGHTMSRSTSFLQVEKLNLIFPFLDFMFIPMQKAHSAGQASMDSLVFMRAESMDH